MINQGQSIRLYKFEELVELRIVEERERYPLLVIRKHDQPKPREYGIHPKVSIEDLRTLMKRCIDERQKD